MDDLDRDLERLAPLLRELTVLSMFGMGLMRMGASMPEAVQMAIRHREDILSLFPCEDTVRAELS